MNKQRSHCSHALRPPTWLRVSLPVVATLLSVVCVNFILSDGVLAWTTLTSGLMTFMATVGSLEAMTCRVELWEESMIIVSNFKKRYFPRSAFSKVVGERGVPVALQTTSGAWVTLPYALAGGPSVAATVRKWLSHS